MRRSARSSGLALDAGEIDGARHMAASGDKAQQIGRCHRGGSIIRQRVVVERVVIEHRGIEHRGDQMLDIVDKGEGRHAAGAHPENPIEAGGAAERKALRSAATRAF